MEPVEIIGWIGATLLATCGVPQMVKTVKSKSFEGLSLTFILWWMAGEVLTMSYVFYKAFRWPLIFNYSINILVCLTILVFYIKYKN